jgi:hypothetical protein
MGQRVNRSRDTLPLEKIINFDNKLQKYSKNTISGHYIPKFFCYGDFFKGSEKKQLYIFSLLILQGTNFSKIFTFFTCYLSLT